MAIVRHLGLDRGQASITGEYLIGELDRIAAQRGTHPAVLRCGNGPEVACGAMADWAAGQVGLCFIPPGEPWRNGYVESFNSRIRDECPTFSSEQRGLTDAGLGSQGGNGFP
jgi:transposase InsO family protein